MDRAEPVGIEQKTGLCRVGVPCTQVEFPGAPLCNPDAEEYW